jgi:hypothetical protein
MAQHGVVSAREYARHPPPALGQAAVSDRVDATEDAMEAARCEPPRDLPAIETERDQLRPSYDAMLPGSDLGDDEVDWSI